MLVMVAVAIFTEGLYLNVTLALWNYIVTQIKFFEYFYAVMLECFRFNFEMFKILLYKVYMLKYRGVCHFVKITLKRWLFFTLILSILPPPIPKKKKKMAECSEETFLI